MHSDGVTPKHDINFRRYHLYQIRSTPDENWIKWGQTFMWTLKHRVPFTRNGNGRFPYRMFGHYVRNCGEGRNKFIPPPKWSMTVYEPIFTKPTLAWQFRKETLPRIWRNPTAVILRHAQTGGQTEERGFRKTCSVFYSVNNTYRVTIFNPIQEKKQFMLFFFASWTVHFVNTCVKNQQMHQWLFICWFSRT
jgi:hypothetical protein